jgi:hypothetical protein
MASRRSIGNAWEPPLPHLDPAGKSFGINLGHGKSLAAYREEAQKCVLVCANCHGEIESGLVVPRSA